MMKRILLVIVLTASCAAAFCQTCTTVQAGNWADASTWSCTGGAASPPNGAWTGGTTININHNVSVENPPDATIDLTTSSVANINVASNISLTFGANGQLSLPAGARITMGTGSTIIASNNSSQSLIRIGTNDVWGNASSAGNGSITGPGYFDQNSTPGSLPITLSFFTARQEPNKVSLNWQTASERNLSYFSIERSSSGGDFQEVAQVKGSGNTFAPMDYSFDDKSPFVGKSYYRIRSVDFDNYEEVFNVVAVDYSGQKTANVFPNPAVNNRINIQLTFTPTSRVNVMITDLTGLLKGRFQLEEQVSSLETVLSPGTYLVKLSSIEFNKVMRVIVH